MTTPTPAALPNCRATAIGSLPHTNPAHAVDFVLRHFAEVPFWPQLPRRAFLENMYVQYSEGLPGVQLEPDQERIVVDLGPAFMDEVEQFYTRFLQESPEPFALSPEYATGLYELLGRGPRPYAWAVKGHVTGPVSFGLTVTDRTLRPSLYDETMFDVLTKNSLRRAQWMEAQLRPLAPRTITFIDEPSLSMVGSAFVSISREAVIAALDEIFAGLQGLTGVHCCGNTDWSMLMATRVDILNFDAYEYTENLVLYPGELRAFLDRGGLLAWGIVPNVAEVVRTMTLDGAWELFERALTLVERKGFHRRELLPRSFITPSCGTGSLPVDVAEHVLELTVQLAGRVRGAYSLD